MYIDECIIGLATVYYLFNANPSNNNIHHLIKWSFTMIWKLSCIVNWVLLACMISKRLDSHSSMMKHRLGGIIQAPRKVTMLECLTLLITYHIIDSGHVHNNNDGDG